MTRRPAILLLALLVFVALRPCPARAERSEDTPDATKVVVHPPDSLPRALRIALGDGGADTSRAPTPAVALVLDATENTTREAPAIVAAVRSLVTPERPWRVGALGRPLGPPVGEPAAIRHAIERALATPTDAIDTLGALARSTAGFGTRGARIVYVADWRMETTPARARSRSVSPVAGRCSPSSAPKRPSAVRGTTVFPTASPP